MPNCMRLMILRFPRRILTGDWPVAAYKKRTLLMPEPDWLPWPGTTTMGGVIKPGMQLVQVLLLLPEPEGGPKDGVSGEIGAKPGLPLSVPLPPEGGPKDGVSGEIGANPGSVPLVPDGGPQDGVSGEIGANPGSVSLVPDGGPQDGVSGERGANPASL